MTLPAFTMSNFAVSRKRLAFLCAVVSVVILLVFFVWAGSRGFFAVAGQDTQRFTELYFASSHSIPLKVHSGQEYSVPFTIVNHEGVAKHYAYQVTVTHGEEQLRQPIRQISIADGQRVQREARFSLPSVTQLVTVSVQLQQPDQTITFRVEP
jgi:uncharacterized membrane protein